MILGTFYLLKKVWMGGWTDGWLDGMHGLREGERKGCSKLLYLDGRIHHFCHLL